MTMTLLDEVTETGAGGRQRYSLTRVYRSETGLTVRVDVRRDCYEHQSSAVAELLTLGAGWRPLLDTPPGGWFLDTDRPGTHNRSATTDGVLAQLGPVADALVDRAAIVLADLR